MDTASILAWWRDARSFFAEHTPPALGQLDNDAVRLERLLQRDEDVVALGRGIRRRSLHMGALQPGQAGGFAVAAIPTQSADQRHPDQAALAPGEDRGRCTVAAAARRDGADPCRPPPEAAASRVRGGLAPRRV